ncbi:probable cytosolic oligopeptidase A [Tanacetum coccineum]|uniref:Probable cytosolic oligopeptidase A n=1 Tax=Tanacetum coccineum TaxID=301880 RepID=A0ABQ5CUL4_9ASTR
MSKSLRYSSLDLSSTSSSEFSWKSCTTLLEKKAVEIVVLKGVVMRAFMVETIHETNIDFIFREVNTIIGKLIEQGLIAGVGRVIPTWVISACPNADKLVHIVYLCLYYNSILNKSFDLSVLNYPAYSSVFCLQGLLAVEDSMGFSGLSILKGLTKLSQKFHENVLDATKKYERLIINKREIEGLSATSFGLAAQTASSKVPKNATTENGPWMISLDAPSFMSVMQHAKNRALREEIYHAYISHTSRRELDNTPVSMATKMATISKADELLEKLRSASWNVVVS